MKATSPYQLGKRNSAQQALQCQITLSYLRIIRKCNYLFSGIISIIILSKEARALNLLAHNQIYSCVAAMKNTLENLISKSDLNYFARPAWHSLNSAHQHLSIGDEHARRYKPDVNLFLATPENTATSLTHAANIIKAGETVFVVQKGPPPVLEGFEMTKSATCVQMVATKAMPDISTDHSILELTDDDAADMLDLALLTEPGPFSIATHKMGKFIGTRINGQLAAMSGQRFRFGNFIELSGVCTHPDFQGQGLGKLFSTLMTKQIQDEGKTPFLHAWKTNIGAIKIYENLGYRIFNEVTASVYVKNA